MINKYQYVSILMDRFGYDDIATLFDNGCEIVECTCGQQTCLGWKFVTYSMSEVDTVADTTTPLTQRVGV